MYKNGILQFVTMDVRSFIIYNIFTVFITIIQYETVFLWIEIRFSLYSCSNVKKYFTILRLRFKMHDVLISVQLLFYDQIIKKTVKQHSLTL